MIYILIGFLFFSLCSADKTKGKNKFDIFLSKYTNEEINSSLSISLDFFNNKEVELHIHHWLLLFLLMNCFENKKIKFLCLGGILQGIFWYDDWYKILYFKNSSISPPKIHT